MTFRMTAYDWMRLDYAEQRVWEAEYYGYEPDPEDLELIERYREQ